MRSDASVWKKETVIMSLLRIPNSGAEPTISAVAEFFVVEEPDEESMGLGIAFWIVSLRIDYLSDRRFLSVVKVDSTFPKESHDLLAALRVEWERLRQLRLS